jgi:hypothetical protein
MVNGFLLFTIVDVWRMILPLGLTLIVFMTGILDKWLREAHFQTIGEALGPLVLRLTLVLAVFSGLTGLLVPSMLGYALPISHLAGGPWGYEEIVAFLLGTLCLWRSRQEDRSGMHLRLLWVGGAALFFSGAGVVWVARWDAMAHAGHVSAEWFALEFPPVEWMRVVPKLFHLVFSGLAAGGIVVTLYGLSGGRGPALGSLAGFYPTLSPSIIRYGIGWILAGVVPQIFIGPWLFLVLGEGPRAHLIDGAGFSSLIFFVSVTAALLALVFLNASFMVPHVKGLVWAGLLCVMTTLVGMGIIRYLVFFETLQAERIPIAIGTVTTFHLLTVLILTALLGAVLIRWGVKPGWSSSPQKSSHSTSSQQDSAQSGQRLDKRFSAN